MLRLFSKPDPPNTNVRPAATRGTIDLVPPTPELVLYSRPGCHLCDEARDAIRLVFEDRTSRQLANPALVERNIEDDPELHRAFLERIPVLVLGEHRAELVITVGKVRRLLSDVMGDTPMRVLTEWS